MEPDAEHRGPQLDEHGRRLCEGPTKRKTRCKAVALIGSPFCLTHDPTTGGISARWRQAAELYKAAQEQERAEQPE